MLTPAKARGGNSPWPPSSKWLNKTAYDVMEYDSAFKKKEILTHGKCREGEWESTYLRDLEQTRTQGDGFSRLKREELEVTMSGGPGDKSWGHMVAQQWVCTHYLNPLN